MKYIIYNTRYISYGRTNILLCSDFNIETIDIKKYDTPTSILLILISWYKKKLDLSKFKFKQAKVVILANTPEEYVFYKEYCTFDCIFANQNAFINPNAFTIVNNVEKEYNLVLNARFAVYKRTELAKQVENIIHIGYYMKNEEYFNDFDNYNYVNFKNNSKQKTDFSILNTDEITEYYNKSYVGGIFSKVEGACCASSEYLLCGIPVVSTESKGGRDIWYNKDNSIICKDNEASVKESVELAIQKVKNDEFNKHIIRENYLKQMDEHKSRLAEFLHNLLKEEPYREYIDIERIKEDLVYYNVK